MKKYLLTLVAIACFALGLSSCSKDSSKDEEVDKLEFSATSINFGADANSQTVYVYSNLSWLASNPSDVWCYVSPYSGSGDGSFTINVDRNNSTSSRSTRIYVYGGSQTDYLEVYQAGSNGGGGTVVPTVPSTPTSVQASATSSSSIAVSWNSVSGANGYNIYRSTSASGSYANIGNSSTTSFTNSGLPASTTYHYKVSAYNNSGESYQSSSASATTLSSGGGGGGGATVPSTPTNVSAANEGNAHFPMIVVRWDLISGATSYKVYRSSGYSGSYTLIGTRNSNAFADENPLSGNNYYRVSALNSAGESSQSNPVNYNYTPSVTSPCPVTYGNCTVSGTTITMRWTNPTITGCGTPTTTYLRVMSTHSSDYINVQTLSGTATSASFNYSGWIQTGTYTNGYVYVGIITENSAGTSGGVPKVYDTKNNRWIN